MDDSGRLAATMRPELVRSRSDRAIELASRPQHGVITLRQIEALGLSARAVRHRVATGRLLRLHRGVYATGRPTAETRWMAAVLACGDGALLSHHSAAALWGLRSDPARWVDVSVPTRGGRACEGIAVHRRETLKPTDATSKHGIPCTSVALTLLDLATVLDRRSLERVIDRAEELRLFDLSAIDRLLAQGGRHRPGSGALANALAAYEAPTITRSEAEERFLSAIEAAAIDRPLVNTWISLENGTGYSPDFLWPDAGLIVEIDGRAYHAKRRAFRHDRQRDRRLALAGFETRRYDASEVIEEPERVAAEVLAFLQARSGPTPVRAGAAENRPFVG